MLVTEHKDKTVMSTKNIITERLLLRPLELRDSTPIQYLAGDPRISVWTSSFTTPFSHQQSVRWVNNTIKAMNSGQSINLSIILRKTGGFIGVVSLRFFENRVPQLGYWLGTEYQGRGYCTEAVSALGLSQLELPEIMARCASNNTASKNVLVRCGMQEVAGEFSSEIIKGKRVPLAVYSKKR